MDRPPEPALPAPPILLEVDNFSLGFQTASQARTKTEPAAVVDQVSFSIADGGSLAIVGESGSGKSVTALSLARLLPSPPAKLLSGDIRFAGKSVYQMTQGELRQLRGREISYIFQEPSTSLNPVQKISQQIIEVLDLHRPDLQKADYQKECLHWLERVGIDKAKSRMSAYPHELSGGMQQRVMIAMALASRPRLLVADEPTTALDSTTQKQILELLAELQKELDMATLLITHNFGIIKNIAQEVAVFYRGKLVEQGEATQVIENPQHPYSKALIECIPRIGDKKDRLSTIEDGVLQS